MQSASSLRRSSALPIVVEAVELLEPAAEAGGFEGCFVQVVTQIWPPHNSRAMCIICGRLRTGEDAAGIEHGLVRHQKTAGTLLRGSDRTRSDAR